MFDVSTQAHKIISNQTDPVGRVLNDLQNYFYAATGAVERYEYEGGVTTAAVMGPIRANLDFAHSDLPAAPFLLREFEAAGLGDKVDDIRTAATEVIAAIVDERVHDGRVWGNGHHIRQEMCAKALIAVAQRLDLGA